MTNNAGVATGSSGEATPIPAVRRGCIELRGVEVHNLKQVDLDVPRHELVVICGVSGSGKTSLALDTLYAEGQRRYIESFSAYTRQFLEQLEKPAARKIDGIPPAIAVTRKNDARGNRSTIGTATETLDYLRLLFAKIGRIYCLGCGREVRRDSPQTAASWLTRLSAGTRFQITFPLATPRADLPQRWQELREDGFARVVHEGRICPLDASPPDVPAAGGPPPDVPLPAAPSNGEPLGADGSVDAPFPTGPGDPVILHVIVDRLTAGAQGQQRLQDSLETAFRHGGGRCGVLVASPEPLEEVASEAVFVDGQPWRRVGFFGSHRCEPCRRDYPELEPRLFSFNSPLGACPTCEGFGTILDIDMELIVPDRGRTLREGAIAPWTTPAYAHELRELLALAADYGLPVDVPVRELTGDHWQLIHDGVPEREFGGLRGFFAWLDRNKYKMPVRVFLSRWRSHRDCPDCRGARLRPEALAVRVGHQNLAAMCGARISDLLAVLRGLSFSDEQRKVARVILAQVEARLGFLAQVGLGYLSLDRTLRTLSGGEGQRVALTSALGSSLVNMLYVLDEPSVGLHPRDVDQLIHAIRGLQARGNSVVVVEHEESMLRAADHLIEIGPGAGDRGGRVVFQGTLEKMLESQDSPTADFLCGRRGVSLPAKRRSARGVMRLIGARGHNLNNLTVDFPLGMLCVVTGVSGSGKSTLVQDTLYPALCRRKRKESEKPLPHDDVLGDGQVDEVMLVDQSPIGRSPRSNPVTYIKAFDEIRRVFAETVDARTHNYSAGHFSFNVDGGRCTKCEGDGYLEIDMQFLADVYMKCGQCHGKRYRQEILAVTYRGKNIAEVLELTVREAFSFFRGQTKVQAKLKQLIDVGLDYLRLGQPANTLSSGEAQRLKLAAYLSTSKRNRTLFILDEPTTGLHFADVVRLLDCFDALLGVGHSLIIVEHNLQVIKSADYVIDLGPGAADEGGQVVAQGTPEEISTQPGSVTGRFLAPALEAARLASRM